MITIKRKKRELENVTVIQKVPMMKFLADLYGGAPRDYREYSMAVIKKAKKPSAAAAKKFNKKLEEICGDKTIFLN